MAVDTAIQAYSDACIDWERIRHCVAGQRVMRMHADRYLHRPDGLGSAHGRLGRVNLDPSSNDEWSRYVNQTDFYDATSRTVEGLTGMAFNRDPVVTLPDSMAEIKEDITLDGLGITGFAEKIFDDVITVGRIGVLVDMPAADPSILNVADAEKAKRRPYVVKYPAESIFYWRTAKVGSRNMLVEIRLHETASEQVAEFEWKEEKRIRVLDLVDGKYRQRVYRKPEKSDDWIEMPELASTPVKEGKPLPFIPFWFINPRDQSDEIVKPPLLGLADANIAHFNTSAKLENVLSFCGAPQPYVTGASDGDEELVIGSTTAWMIPNENAKVDYLSLGTEGVDALEKRLDRLETRMAMLGARMLSPDQKGVEAAETAQIHRQGEVSVVSSACNSTSQAITEVLTFMGIWMGLKENKESISFRIQTDFFDRPADPAKAVEMMKLWQGGVIGYSDFLAWMKKGQLVAAQRTEEAIQAENETGLITPSGSMALA